MRKDFKDGSCEYNSCLIDSSEIRANTQAWYWFEKAMMGKQYSATETKHAWEWFLRGYQGHVKEVSAP